MGEVRSKYVQAAGAWAHGTVLVGATWRNVEVARLPAAPARERVALAALVAAPLMPDVMSAAPPMALGRDSELLRNERKMPMPTPPAARMTNTRPTIHTARVHREDLPWLLSSHELFSASGWRALALNRRQKTSVLSSSSLELSIGSAYGREGGEKRVAWESDLGIGWVKGLGGAWGGVCMNAGAMGSA